MTVVRARGSTPQRAGAKMLVYADGRTVGTIGGGCYENDAAGKAREAIRTRTACVARYDLSDALADESGPYFPPSTMGSVGPVEDIFSLNRRRNSS